MTETPPLSRPWVKKGLAGCFLHRLLQDGDGLSGPALPGHVQLRADRHALRCQDVVVVVGGRAETGSHKPNGTGKLGGNRGEIPTTWLGARRSSGFQVCRQRLENCQAFYRELRSH